ncbi:MAG: acetyltransferase [Lachnospiraceae bacterium]|nr:acetyltransferase [Lachnospiraceae bacterium]
MIKLVIFGAGGLGKEVVNLIKAINSVENKYELLGYVVDTKYFNGNQKVHGYDVLGTEKWIIDHADAVKCVCAVGRPLDRRSIMQRLEKDGVQFETLIHPDCFIDETAVIGDGTIIQSKCSVSCDVTIGKGGLLNGDVIIGHDCTIGEYVTIYPRGQISGKAVIGNGCLLGSMTFLNEKVKVGDEAVIAPGSIVLTRVKEKTHVMGNPAKRIDI